MCLLVLEGTQGDRIFENDNAFSVMTALAFTSCCWNSQKGFVFQGLQLWSALVGIRLPPPNLCVKHVWSKRTIKGGKHISEWLGYFSALIMSPFKALMLYLFGRREQVFSKKWFGVFTLTFSCSLEGGYVIWGQVLITLMGKQLRLEWVQEVTGGGLQSRARDITWLSVCH